MGQEPIIESSGFTLSSFLRSDYSQIWTKLSSQVNKQLISVEVSLMRARLALSRF